MASDRVRRSPQEKIVILDTNAILMLFEFSIDLKDELTRLLGVYRLIIPTAIIEELNILIERGEGVRAMRAKAALQFVKDAETRDAEGTTGDDAVVHLARELNGIVVTNDKKLRQQLKEYSVPVIYLRKKQFLCME
ncbi:MAG: DNA-binding protein [Methanobacteriota archaeon]